MADRLPATRLTTQDGAEASLRDGRGPRAVVTVHDADCPGCRGYLESLVAASGAASEWDGRFLAVVPAAPADPADPADPPVAAFAASAAGLPSAPGGGAGVLFDRGGVIADGRATVAVADEWGEVFFSADAGGGHNLPDAAELVEWLRFAAIQCPECENPEGAWRTLPT